LARDGGEKWREEGRQGKGREWGNQRRTGIGVHEKVRLVQVLEDDAVAGIEVLDELLHGDVACGGGGREGGRGGKGW